MGEIQCYRVGDCDWVAAYSPEEALEIMREIAGHDDFDFEDVDLATDAALDMPWVDEDDRTVYVGCLREYLAESDEPRWLAGTE